MNIEDVKRQRQLECESEVHLGSCADAGRYGKHLTRPAHHVQRAPSRHIPNPDADVCCRAIDGREQFVAGERWPRDGET